MIEKIYEMIEKMFFPSIGCILISLLSIFFGLLFKGIDRKIVARMQKRVGPPIKQPFLDVAKLMIKENVIPETAVKWMYNIAPIICLASSILLMLYIPIPGLEKIQLHTENDIILIVYIFIIPALAMVAGGFASGSPFATIGAQREMVTMISYEFPLAISVIAIAWKLSAFSENVFALSFISSNPILSNVGLIGFIGSILLLLSLIIVIPGEVAKIPFDVAEAETEIAQGVLVEYSGRNLALFYMADGVRIFAMASLIVNIFFPYNISSILGLSGYPSTIADFIFFLLKVFLLIFFSVTIIRAGMARLRINQVVTSYWVTITLISLVGLLLLIWDNQFAISLPW
ncbi:MAG: complex I subunit 1 family protein [Candidatus Thermoplasmatota archaeon]